MFGMMQRAAGAVISNGEWVISFFSQVNLLLIVQLYSCDVAVQLVSKKIRGFRHKLGVRFARKRLERFCQNLTGRGALAESFRMVCDSVPARTVLEF